MTLTDTSLSPLLPGQRLARGTARLLCQYDFQALEEFVPARGLRVDLMAIGPKSEIWIVECKSCRADYQTDTKWQGYLDWCDRFFWAVDEAFPNELLPAETGLIVADAYGGELLRMAPEQKLAPARRKRLVQDFARVAARRLMLLRDPDQAGF